MNELEQHRAKLLQQRGELRVELERLTAERGGEEAADLRAALEPLEREVAELTRRAEGLSDRAKELLLDVEPLRVEARAAKAHLKDLTGAS